jgi:hypothetical protein
MRASCLLLSAIAVVLLAGCGRGARVRDADPAELNRIRHAVAETWEYESFPLYEGPARRRPRLRPVVIRADVSQSDPAFASAVVALEDRRGRRGTPAVVVLRGKYVVAGPGVTFAGGCDAATPTGLRPLVCPDPWSVLRYPRPRIRIQTAYTQQVAALDVRALDWRKVALPGGVCGSSRPIRPPRRDLEAFIRPDVNLLWWNPVWVYSWSHPVFGDIDADGRDEAALQVVCANGGGTADGQLAFSAVIFKLAGSSLRVLGIIRPRQPAFAPADHVPVMDVTALRPGRIVTTEAWYGPYDGTCCGSGRARTTWIYRGGALQPRTTVEREPRSGSAR